MEKTTSKHLAKKLTQYGAMAAALGTVAEINGQVIYTDITDFNGDSTSTFDLDLNNDAVIDFTIFGSSTQILVDASSNEVLNYQKGYDNFRHHGFIPLIGVLRLCTQHNLEDLNAAMGQRY